MASETVRLEVSDDVAHIGLDDGKANALSPSVLTAIDSALDEVEKSDAKALVLSGRPGRFTGGFDLSVMGSEPSAAGQMVRQGGELAVRLYEFPLPVVIACTGHAVAMGAILLCSADWRVGARGEFKIGLNEVAIGLTLPVFGIELANDRLSRRHLTRAVLTSEFYDPQGAVDAGFLDVTEEPDEVLAAARRKAQQLAGALDLRAHVGTKLSMRGATTARIRASLGG